MLEREKLWPQFLFFLFPYTLSKSWGRMRSRNGCFQCPACPFRAFRSAVVWLRTWEISHSTRTILLLRVIVAIHDTNMEKTDRVPICRGQLMANLEISKFACLASFQEVGRSWHQATTRLVWASLWAKWFQWRRRRRTRAFGERLNQEMLLHTGKAERSTPKDLYIQVLRNDDLTMALADTVPGLHW